MALSGDLDRLTGPTVLELVERVSGNPIGRIDIDLAHVGFLDLGGVRTLLRVHQRGARHGIAVVVQRPQHHIRWLLDITGAAAVLMERHAWTIDAVGDTAFVRLMQARVMRADDRDRLADEREKMLDERQQRVSDHQRWEDIREELADQREMDLERRERDD
ncbi:STAS domain-containing protein [Actinoplanes sp. NPDC004185]